MSEELSVNSQLLAMCAPVPPISDLAIHDALSNIRSCGIRREWAQGNRYISALPPDVRSNIDVCHESAGFYLAQGRVDRAAEAIDAFGADEYLQHEDTLYEESAAVLFMIRAEINALQNLDYIDILSVINQVEAIYVRCEGSIEKTSPVADKIMQIRLQSALWSSTESDISGTPLTLSDNRVFIELELITLYTYAMNWGLLHSEKLDKLASARLPPLITLLRASNRRVPEAACIFATEVVRYQGNMTNASVFLKDYLDTLDQPEHAIFRGVALSFSAELIQLSNLDRGLILLDQGRGYLDGHQTHLTDSEFVHLRGFLEKSHTAESRHAQSISLCDKYKSIEDIYGELRTTLLAIEVGVEGKKAREETIALVERTEKRLIAVRNHHAVRELRINFACVCAPIIDCSEDARGQLESLIYSKVPVNERQYGEICNGLAGVYDTLGDYKIAADYAHKYVESAIAKRDEERGSLSIRKYAMVQRHYLMSIQKDHEAFDALKCLATLVEEWAERDEQAGRLNYRRSKVGYLVLIYRQLQEWSGNENFSNALDHWTSIQTNLDTRPDPILHDNATFNSSLYVHAIRKDYWGGLKIAQRQLKAAESDPFASLNTLSTARTAVAMFTELACLTLTDEQRPLVEEMRSNALELLKTNIAVLGFQRDVDEYMGLCYTLCRTLQGCMISWPERHREFIDILTGYLSEADKICREIRQGLLLKEGVKTWLRRRQVVALQNFAGLYSHGVETCLALRDSCSAWNFLQRGRARAMLDTLQDKNDSLKPELRRVFERSETLGPLLDKDTQLANVVNKSTADEYPAAMRDLRNHRERMKANPTVHHVLQGPATSTPVWNDLEDIWNLRSWLPEGRNIVLVDWFIRLPDTVYRFSMDFKRRTLNPTWWLLGRNLLQKVMDWKKKYLKFPIDEERPLERDLGALRCLRPLLSGLEKITEPGDLLVFVLPSPFSGLPLHAVPLMGKRPVIDRNQVIYASSVELFRQCHQRVRQRSSKIEGPLGNIIFTAAYEEPGFESEREKILQQATELAHDVAGQIIAGKCLTSTSMTQAFSEAAWLHYHGHAYYARTNALDQSLVLAPLPGESVDISSPSLEEISRTESPASAKVEIDADLGSLTQATSAEAQSDKDETPPKEALLSDSLFQNSSRITVSDIFAMNLSEKHPVICTIACDSGVQDVGTGDEPFGLVPALFCAGASSVVGTLWPIQSDTGRLFSHHFYAHLKKQIESDEGKEGGSSERPVVNIAAAFREATLQVKRVKPDPYSWAAFTMNGAGFSC